MSKHALTLLLTLAICAGSPAQPRLSHYFVNEDLGAVVRFLGEAAGRKVFLGPGVAGKLTVAVRSTPPMAALHEVLKSFSLGVAYKLIGNDVLVVARPECKLEGCDDARANPMIFAGNFCWNGHPPQKSLEP